MSRLLRIGLIAVLSVLVVGGLWWIGTDSDAPYPETTSVDGLADSTLLRWSEEGVAHIETAAPLDFYSALGYIHGVNRGWTLTLWRQTARGRLGRWFGTGVTALDRHARRLGLARQAQRAYDRLRPSSQRRLRAYVDGLNAALHSSSVRDASPFVLLDVEPGSWAPWHALLIERLLAWLSTPSLHPPDPAPASVDAFARTDRQFRRWLHLHGWSRSVAWTARPERDTATAPTLFQRHVLGASALPVVQEIAWDRSSSSLTAATLPGLPLLFAGRTDAEGAWASLLRSPASLHQTALDSSALREWHERVAPDGGDEQLVHVQRHDGALLLSPSPPSPTPSSPPSDSSRRMGWEVRWPGFRARSDVSAWLQRAGLGEASPGSATFTLFAADGLRVPAEGAPTVLGSPPVVARDNAERLVLIGASRWARHQAQSLRDVIRDETSRPVRTWSASDSSAWAADLLPPLLSNLRSTPPPDSRLRDATTYLRNWDHQYAPTSIGATLFDQWMRAYRDEVGPVPSRADTSNFFAAYRQRRALRQAVDTLTAQFGPDLRRWRWERVVTDRRFFPVWSADSLVDADLQALRTTRYAPLDRTAQGHPSAPSGGPSLVDPSPVAPSPTAWEGWTRPQGGFTVRRHHYDPSVVFARSRLRTDRPAARTLRGAQATHTTVLVPSEE